MPLLGALLIGQRRVQDGDFVSEHLMQIGGHRRRKPDLRNQQDGRASCFQNRAHGGEIDRRLARSSDPVQQHAGELAARVMLSSIRLQRLLLRRIELKVQRRGPRLHVATVNSAGSSTISTNPRFTSVLSVVRGTSSVCSVSTATLPPAAARVSINVC